MQPRAANIANHFSNRLRSRIPVLKNRVPICRVIFFMPKQKLWKREKLILFNKMNTIPLSLLLGQFPPYGNIYV